MKRFLLKVLTGMIMMTFLYFGNNASVDAATTTKTLTEDTRITPPGAVVTYWATTPTFKKGTTVVLNEYGEVIEGVLESYTALLCVSIGQFNYRQSFGQYVGNVEPNRIRTFKSDTKVTFNDKGEVIRGTIGESMAWVPVSQSSYLVVQKDTEVSFHANGMVATCTLDSDTYLRPIGWQNNLTAGYTNKVTCPGFVEFKSGTQVQLNEKGEVIKGTLNKDSKLPTAYGIRVYEPGTTVEFDDTGVVVKTAKLTL